MQSYAMLIDGRSVNTSEQDPVINPAFGEPFATCARGTKQHVGEAVDAAARAFKTWRKDEAFRRQKLNECAAALQAKANDIAPILSQEQGKPVQQAMMEIFGASMWFSYFASLEIAARGAAGRRREEDPGGAQAARRRRRDHAVELPGDPAVVEARAGVPRRQHGGREAVAVHAAVDL